MYLIVWWLPVTLLGRKIWILYIFIGIYITYLRYQQRECWHYELHSHFGISSKLLLLFSVTYIQPHLKRQDTACAGNCVSVTFKFVLPSSVRVANIRFLLHCSQLSSSVKLVNWITTVDKWSCHLSAQVLTVCTLIFKSVPFRVAWWFHSGCHVAFQLPCCKPLASKLNLHYYLLVKMFTCCFPLLSKLHAVWSSVIT